MTPVLVRSMSSIRKSGSRTRRCAVWEAVAVADLCVVEAALALEMAANLAEAAAELVSGFICSFGAGGGCIICLFFCIVLRINALIIDA